MAAKIWSHGVIHHAVALISRVLRGHLNMDSSLNAADEMGGAYLLFRDRLSMDNPKNNRVVPRRITMLSQLCTV